MPAGDNVVRIMPPLTMTEDEIALAVERLEQAAEAVEAKIGGRSGRMTANGSYRNFLDLTDFEGDDLRAILATSRKIKAERNGVHRGVGPLAGKVLAMIFEQPSTRTRISFDVGMRELGGETLMLTVRRCSSAAGRPSPTRRGCCPVSSMPS